MTRNSALALTGVLWLAGGAEAPAQGSRPAPVPVVAAPARTVMVPPNETVTLTPVYPVHYPAPIYITPPLYGHYIPPYYLPVAYYRAEVAGRDGNGAPNGASNGDQGHPDTGAATARRNVPPPLTSGSAAK